MAKPATTASAQMLEESACHVLGTLLDAPAFETRPGWSVVTAVIDCGHDQIVRIEAPVVIAEIGDDTVVAGLGATVASMAAGDAIEVRGHLQVRPLRVVPRWTRALPCAPDRPKARLETGPLTMSSYDSGRDPDRQEVTMTSRRGATLRAVLPRNTWVATGSVVSAVVLPQRRTGGGKLCHLHSVEVVA
ncbi:MAG: hypothetical protein ACYCXY_13475 [Acidimicrobiales bacterium]